MKKLNLLILTILILFASCSKDDINNEDLIGSWKLTAINLTTPLDINGDGLNSLNIVEEYPIIEASLIFADEVNGSIYYNSYVSFATRMENGNLIFMIASSFDSDSEPKQFAYSENNNEININEDVTFNHVNNSTTLILENDTLSMAVKRGFVVTDIDTLEESVVQDVTYIFTRE